jgi:hypothetical protein
MDPALVVAIGAIVVLVAIRIAAVRRNSEATLRRVGYLPALVFEVMVI